MKNSIYGVVLCAAIAAVAFAPTAFAKTAKECRAEWTADKAANQAKGITEKAYVDKCRAEDSADKTKAAPAAKIEEKAPAKEKEKAVAKEKATTKTAAPAAGDKKTVKECQDEWRANKAANQAKGITEKAYVEQCRSGTAAMTPPPAAPAKASAPAAAEKPAAKMAPAPEPAKPAAKSEPAPASGKPEGANQFAAENQAKSHCPSGLVVWANLDSKIYHFSGHSDYGHTKEGAYMCEKDAEAQGMRAAKNEKRP